ncbi:hypothetical protein IGJ62_001824 [Enterococcus pernyi]
MKIRILKNVRLDFEGKVKEYPSSNQVLQIDDQLALEKNYLARYKKYPKHIEVVEEPKIKVNEQKNEDLQTEGSKASSKTESNKKGNKKRKTNKDVTE